MNKRDTEILRGLWRWKLLSTAAITEIYFQDSTPAHAYRQLTRIRDRGLICMVPVPEDIKARSFVWSLTAKGFRTVKETITKLHEDGFRSENTLHDSIVNAVHLGSWIFGVPEECSLYSEQQLRRYHPEHYPTWIPQDGSRRPDGFWQTSLNGQTGTIALEVELKRKFAEDYRSIAQSYALKSELFRVVWVVPSPGIAEFIFKAIQETGGKAARLHSFLLLNDFKDSGWNAPFILGRDTEKCLSDLLPIKIDRSAQYIAPRLLLDFRKSPHITQSYRKLKETLKMHRLGSSLFVPTPISNVPQNLKQGENHDV